MKKSSLKKPKIDLNPQFLRALELMNDAVTNVFVTGRAGTGKSTLLQYFRESTKINVVVLAPTGVAAINVNGQTIHSFFGFGPDVTMEKVKKMRPKKPELYEKMRVMVIDEISMVRADLLDCIDHFLRLHGPVKKQPFGGVKLVFIGDLYQLPPVTTSRERELFGPIGMYESPYFYSAHVFNKIDLYLIELETIYRQKDDDFIRVLNAVRNNSVTEEDLALLNTRHQSGFEPDMHDTMITLTSTNDRADAINRSRLSFLDGEEFRFEAKITGEIGREYYPTAEVLELRAGAQVMMLNNDSGGRWVNGTIGRIDAIEFDEEMDEALLQITLDNGESVEVMPHTWDVYEFRVAGGVIDAEIIGSFTQYPLRLAFAVTIHKSQGKTFQNVILDLDRGTFAHGQMYVALSRCTTLGGLILKQQIKKSHIRLDYGVMKFLTKYQYRMAEKKMPFDEKVALIKKAIKEKKKLRIVYLKAKDEKSERIVLPKKVGEMEYSGHLYTGMEAYCMERKQDRVFNVERIVEIEQSS